MTEDHAESVALTDFSRHRPLLFTIAYEMLGSAADAEDVVQETWVRWSAADGTVEHPRAYLVQIVTRLSLNRLRSLSRSKEVYVGPWLPEPLATHPDVADDVVLAESVSMAMMVVLESLTPDERAVFVLGEVFGFPHTEIAHVLDRTPASVRQLAHRSRQHVQARRPRFDTSPAVQAEVSAAFKTAVETGDLRTLMRVLAPDVVMVSDGGGTVSAALRPVQGADKVGRFLIGVVEKGRDQEWQTETVLANGQHAWRMFVGSATTGAGYLQFADGLITGIYLVMNPEKLGHILGPRNLARG